MTTSHDNAAQQLLFLEHINTENININYAGTLHPVDIGMLSINMFQFVRCIMHVLVKVIVAAGLLWFTLLGKI